MVVIRGKDDVVRVLSRVCPHRGMDVNPTEFGRPAKGNARFLLCPYHFWSYDLDGRCKGAPEMQKAAGFNRKDVGLPAFRSEVWNGFIFVTFAGDIPPCLRCTTTWAKSLRNSSSAILKSSRAGMGTARSTGK